MADHFFVYIMSNKSRTLYIGYTNDLFSRVIEHKQKTVAGFTSRYNINRLLYWETYENSQVALRREKQLKGWTRAKKIALIEVINPDRQDLSEDWENRRSFAEAFVSTRKHSVNPIDGLILARQLLSAGKE